MRIAIVKLSALGDIVHAMIVLQFIKKFNKDISIDWIVEECYSELLDFNPDINRVHKVNFKQFKKRKSLFFLLRELRKVHKFGKFDLVIDLQGLIKSAIVAKLISSDKIFGFDKYSVREPIASRFYSNKINIGYSENVVNRNVALISEALKIKINRKDISSKLPFLYCKKEHEFDFLSLKSPNILFILGASYSSKRYPIEKTSNLIDSISANFIVIWGNENEKKLAEKLKKLSPKVIVSKKLNINDLISLIAQVSLVIGPDTGPTHMAWALNTRSITLFGPTPGYRNTYNTKINKVLESNSKVNPNKINKKDFSIKTIDVNDIAKLTLQLMSKKD
jgi:heptosyltransferase I